MSASSALQPDSANRADCYAELAVSSPAVAETIASTHCTYPQKDGWLDLVACKILGWQTSYRWSPATNQVRRSSTFFDVTNDVTPSRYRHKAYAFDNNDCSP